MLLAVAVAVAMPVAGSAAASGRQLDSRFGGGTGFVTTSFGAQELAHLGDVLPTARGVAAVGLAGWPLVRQGFAVARYRADGSLDSALGSGGKVLVQVPDSAEYSGVRSPDPLTRSLLAGALAAPGAGVTGREIRGADIVMAGVLWPDVFAAFLPAEVVAARVRPDGSLDRSYGKQGIAVVPVAPVVLGAAYTANLGVHVFPDGSLLATLWTYTLPPCGFGVPCVPSASYLTFVRLDRTGVLDQSFGIAGVVVQPTPEALAYDASTVLPDGSIVVAGAGLASALVRRFRPDGTLDMTFGTASIVRIDTSLTYTSLATALAPAPGGGVFVATSGEQLLATATRNQVQRLDRRGSSVRSFGRAGVARLPAAHGYVAGAALASGDLALTRNLVVDQHLAVDAVDLDPATGAVRWTTGNLPGVNPWSTAVALIGRDVYVGGDAEVEAQRGFVVYALQRIPAAAITGTGRLPSASPAPAGASAR